MIKTELFINSIKKFKETEKRGSFYDMACKLLENNYEIEGYTLILATWNFARFRYFVKYFDINGFKETIYRLNPFFEKFIGMEFRNIDFDNYKNDISIIFKTLSSIPGIEFTGASKIMYLKNRKVFLMWDSYIKGEKSPKKYYYELDIVKKGFWEVKKYNNNWKSYLQFLKDMKSLYKNIVYQEKERTFAKAIDEFNYLNITIPFQKKL
ncbi:unnamed protein product, partial [marine sediment metagenome]